MRPVQSNTRSPNNGPAAELSVGMKRRLSCASVYWSVICRSEKRTQAGCLRAGRSDLLRCSRLRIPARPHPKAGQNCSAADRTEHPFNTITRQVVSFGHADAVQRKDHQAASDPFTPVHGKDLGTNCSRAKLSNRSRTRALSLPSDDETTFNFVLWLRLMPAFRPGRKLFCRACM
jgi:hypothetical protein